MLVFLVGEGPNDIGGLSRSPPYQTEAPGFLQPIVRRVLDRPVTFRGRKLAVLPRQPLKGGRRIGTRRAAAAVSIAEALDADLLVLVTDLDGGSTLRDRRTAQRAHDAKRSALRDGLAGAGIPSAVGVPCRTIEAWALGDPVTLRSLFGDSADHMPTRSPEELWGSPTDPASSHPKHVLARVLGGDRATSENLSAVADACDLTKLRGGCSMSFVPFADDLAAAA